MESIKLRKVTEVDLIALQEIGRETFHETFASVNTQANMRKYLEEGFSEDKLRAELNDPNAEFYFASVGNLVVGYLKVNFGQSQTELKDGHGLEIERIYVLKDYQGKSVGQLLYDQAISIARIKACEYVWLGVWEENHRAINFYRKNGFVEFDKHIFKLGDDIQTDIMMKKEL